MDNYFRNREEYPLDENGQPDFEALGCVDIPQFNEDMNALLCRKAIELHGLISRQEEGVQGRSPETRKEGYSRH